jgi:hypothetical protein
VLEGKRHFGKQIALVEWIPFTDNQAEGNFCPTKVKQKVSGYFRPQQKARVYTRLQVVISTCRKQGRSVYVFLHALFALARFLTRRVGSYNLPQICWTWCCGIERHNHNKKFKSEQIPNLLQLLI